MATGFCDLRALRDHVASQLREHGEASSGAWIDELSANLINTRFAVVE
jgi:hypothetical protein